MVKFQIYIIIYETHRSSKNFYDVLWTTFKAKYVRLAVFLIFGNNLCTLFWAEVVMVIISYTEVNINKSTSLYFQYKTTRPIFSVMFNNILRDTKLKILKQINWPTFFLWNTFLQVDNYLLRWSWHFNIIFEHKTIFYVFKCTDQSSLWCHLSYIYHSGISKVHFDKNITLTHEKIKNYNFW